MSSLDCKEIKRKQVNITRKYHNHTHARFLLTQLNLASFLKDKDKRSRPISDTAERFVWLGFAYILFY